MHRGRFENPVKAVYIQYQARDYSYFYYWSCKNEISQNVLMRLIPRENYLRETKYMLMSSSYSTML